ncbi:tyrosine-type recombinase/integrase [Duganella sp. FT92W]|uniref:Tyrosine-type recombinase/integrase n=1 Tax=Pseudoduganella rivuli TaxID=2666085 RepID=A0A7X2LRL9_9BURK|nr:site-specific integrase [Pseudoduganella rivuli]MRV72585.1 tyrosine-type recombinase/integrase [Pseudoduganella rivuli]
MASITKQKTGWRVQLSIKGQRDSCTFSTKAEAQAWAAEREAQLRRMADTGVNTDKTCQDAFDRYLIEVSAHKRGERWEEIRLRAISMHKLGDLTFGEIRVSDVTAELIGKWRDMRLKDVAGATVNRELNLLSHVFTTARREWKWIAVSPTADVRRPKGAPPRDRRITEDEIDRICLALGFAGEVATKSDAVAVAFLFAIETAMRAGEICNLTWEHVYDNVVHLPRTKNGSKRDVPLSARAADLLKLLPAGKPQDACFGITAASLDALFRKAKARTEIENLTFHDTRHEAITRLASKLNVLELARVVGHKDLRMLQVYYNESAADIAKKL